MKFTKIPVDTFQKLQINAGVLTTDFTPATGTIGEAGQIGATTGGVNFSATPADSSFKRRTKARASLPLSIRRTIP